MFYTFSSIRYNLYEEFFLFSISFSYLYSYCVHFSYLISLQDPNACFREYRYEKIKTLFMVFSGKSYGFFSLPKMNGYLIPMAGQLDSPRDDNGVELAEHLLLGCQAPLLHLLSVHNRAITIG